MQREVDRELNPSHHTALPRLWPVNTAVSVQQLHSWALSAIREHGGHYSQGNTAFDLDAVLALGAVAVIMDTEVQQ